ncbi:ParA family protein [Paracoccus aerius]|jgi:chromosome partitioning protein|uniref:ParA family protein n=1 Tax=Paracoccus aerius TaxID=1915382 RepID=A0ABS1SAD4_9RHOB|nr:ParA family protein [Paracoccus aerius]MBL3675707.1 ParA family protein [Paracoccus aerius]GHG36970.1 chromosome partitioning protein ParA [Paracoccus aerius]
MQVIVLATQKGGSGKSTLARSIAAEMTGRGRVAMLDLDPQGSLTKWWQRREADDLQLVTGLTRADQIAKAVDTLREQGFDWLIIDTPGARDEATRIALHSADLVLVPVHPSQDDLDAVGPTVAEIKEAGAEFIFVLSRTTRARIVDEVGRLLAAHGRVAPALIGARVAHGEAATRGLTAAEAGNAAASEEVRALVDYVTKELA